MTDVNTDPGPAIPTVCDLVMKGGIASGVVYPGAIVELAKQYRFHRIGGSSAGAIAAAITAAAEYRRQHARRANDALAEAAAFDCIRELPKALGASVGGRSRLFSLFAPQPALRRPWTALTALVGGGIAAPLRLFAAGLVVYPWLFLAALPALLLVALGSAPTSMAAQWTELALVVLFAVLSLAIALVVQLGYDLWHLGRHGFGFCTGGNAADDPTPRLSAWLHAQIQAAAGKPLDQPLTFRDLWEAPHPYGGESSRQRPGIDLRVTTTNLTWQQLMAVPSDGGDHDRLYFDRDEIMALMPPAVARHMIAAGEALLAARQGVAPDGEPSPPSQRLPLPYAQLPVLFAVRMSLSFPILLTPIRLYARDFRRLGPTQSDPAEQKRVDREAQLELREVWFSDGGICSNLPVHFFDSALPTHPTFAINLSEPHPDHDKSPERTPLFGIASNANYGADPYWMGWKRGDARLLKFLLGIVDTARNWSDFTQMRLDGQRDRIMHVALKDDEGGLNLDMPAELISTLSRRGGDVATQMRERFTAPEVYRNGASAWQGHRWLRTRTSLYALAEYFDDVHDAARLAAIRDLEVIADWVEHAPGDGNVQPATRDAFQRLLAHLEPIVRDSATLATILGDPKLSDLNEGDAPAKQRMSRRPALRLRPRL
jgi:predicted acylesterase/phospholipase RssA